MSKQRGIVFCPHFEENDGDVYIPHVQIRDDQMQFFCLYWDYIIQPVSAQLPRWKKSTNEKVLESSGILINDYQDLPEDARKLEVKENAYSLKSEGAKEWAPKFLEFQASSLEKAQKEQPDVIWTPQQSTREFFSANDKAFDAHCIQLKLHSKLPVPSGNATIRKIVTFKHENQDLFNELKRSIDNFTHFVAQAGDANEYSLNLAEDDIEKITREISSASKQRFGKLVKFEDFKINIGSANLTTVLGNFVKGSTLSSVSGDPVLAMFGGLANSATSFIKLEPTIAKRLKCIPDDQIELGYLTKAKNEHILSGM
ncbi:DUF6236 family protein [Agarivorans sp. DSG3-1]|uniref:DUF6236 family protein n=1 Tax=Agarivorans sp. DSG3-1 TaxID=3342249 RepID=UPI00398F163B